MQVPALLSSSGPQHVRARELVAADCSMAAIAALVACHLHVVQPHVDATNIATV